MSGKQKYNIMLKSMIARLEFSNYLAPIHSYARHQTRAGAQKKKKKKNAKKVLKLNDGGAENGEEKHAVETGASGPD
jgi:hypothetical protein